MKNMVETYWFPKEFIVKAGERFSVNGQPFMLTPTGEIVAVHPEQPKRKQFKRVGGVAHP